MPKLNQVKLGRQIGKDGGQRFIWSACKGCNKERWVRFMHGKAIHDICPSCAMHRRHRSVHFLCPKCKKVYYVKWRSMEKWERIHHNQRFKFNFKNKQEVERVCRNCKMKEVGRINIRHAIGSRKANYSSEHLNGQGYIVIRLSPDSPYFLMAHKGLVKKHRLVVAQHLNRVLEPWEIVHHKDSDKLNNELSNLEVHPQTTHASLTSLIQEVQQLRNENEQLKQELKNARIYA